MQVIVSMAPACVVVPQVFHLCLDLHRSRPAVRGQRVILTEGVGHHVDRKGRVILATQQRASFGCRNQRRLQAGNQGKSLGRKRGVGHPALRVGAPGHQGTPPQAAQLSPTGSLRRRTERKSANPACDTVARRVTAEDSVNKPRWRVEGAGRKSGAHAPRLTHQANDPFSPNEVHYAGVLEVSCEQRRGAGQVGNHLPGSAEMGTRRASVLCELNRFDRLRLVQRAVRLNLDVLSGFGVGVLVDRHVHWRLPYVASDDVQTGEVEKPEQGGSHREGHAKRAFKRGHALGRPRKEDVINDDRDK